MAWFCSLWAMLEDLGGAGIGCVEREAKGKPAWTASQKACWLPLKGSLRANMIFPPAGLHHSCKRNKASNAPFSLGARKDQPTRASQCPSIRPAEVWKFRCHHCEIVSRTHPSDIIVLCDLNAHYIFISTNRYAYCNMCVLLILLKNTYQLEASAPWTHENPGFPFGSPKPIALHLGSRNIRV